MQAATAKNSTSSKPASSLEIEYNDLTPERFSATVKRHGGFLIRSLFKPEEAADLIQEVGDLYFLIENLESNGLLASNGVKYLKGGHPANLLPNMGLLQNLLNKPRLIEALQHYFNESDLVVYLEPTAVRSCNPNGWKNYLPWHQDVFHRGDRFFTIWIPLSRVGEKAPGLEIVPYKLEERLAKHISGLNVAYDGKGVSEELINTAVGTERLQPVMNVGDVLVFDPYTLHRTYIREDMDTPRISLDVRINPLSSNPAGPNSNNENEEWKTEILRFPASEVVRKTGKGRPMFNIKHLLLPVVSEPAAMASPSSEPDVSIKTLLKQKVKRKIKKLVYEFTA